MSPDSKNYTRQHDKISAKAEQCLAMNALAGSPYSEADILASCGLTPPTSECVKVSADVAPISGACGDLSFIKEANLPQCCALEGGIHATDCGADAEWVVGVATYPVCYVPNS